MQKLRTTVSVMHITAHPDDEHGGVLAKLSRGDGARVTLLTLNRGESGDNAIGPQLFDALGLIRTEELLVSNRYYGVDQQYFTTVVDYGFSKTLEESLAKWGRETVLRDVVRDHPHGAAGHHPVSLPGQRTRRARQPPGRGTDGDGSVSGRGRTVAISGAAQGRTYAVAGGEGLRRRHAAGGELDGRREHWRVQPHPRRLVRQHRPLWAQLPTIAEQRPLHAEHRSNGRPTTGWPRRLPAWRRKPAPA